MMILALAGGAAFGALRFVGLHYTTLNMGVDGSVSPEFIVDACNLLFRTEFGRCSSSACSPRSSACWRS